MVVITIIATVGSILGVAVVVWFITQGRDDRANEEAARNFFAAHGRWPDDPVP